jgi:hypothetical protein
MTTRRAPATGLVALALVLAITLASFPSPAQASWSAGPNAANWPWADDSGWVVPVCGDGWCHTETIPVAGLFEYVPHRESTGLNAGPAPEHGGDPTFVARVPCSYRGIRQGWSAGVWRHYAFWTFRAANGVWRWEGPTMPHWSFAPGGGCGEATNPTRTPPPPTPPPSGGGTATVRVEAMIVGELPEGLSGAPLRTRGGGTYPVGAWVDAAVEVPESWTTHGRWGGVTVSGCGVGAVGRREVRFAALPGGCTLRFLIAFRAWAPSCTGLETSHLPRPVPIIVRPARGASVLSGAPTMWEAPQPMPYPSYDGNADSALANTRWMLDDPLVQARAFRLSGGEYVDIVLPLGSVRRNNGSGSLYGAFYEEGGAASLTFGIIDLGPRGAGPVRLPFWLHAGRDYATVWRSKDGKKERIGYGTALAALYLDGKSWKDLPDRGRPPAPCRDDPTCAPTYTPFPDASARLIGPQTFAAWNGDHLQWEHLLWRGGAPPPPEFIPGIQPNFAVGRTWLEPATDLGVRLRLTPGHRYGVVVGIEAKACNEHYAAHTAAIIGAEGRLIGGQVWDATRRDAMVPANRKTHVVTLEASFGNLTRMLGQTGTDAQARFTLMVTRADIDRLVMDAGGTPAPDARVQLRLRLTPNTAPFDNDPNYRYLPTQIPARPPDGFTADSAEPLAVAWTATREALLARDWDGAAFFVARYPRLPPIGPDARLCLHMRHADRGAAWQTTCPAPEPSRAMWLYGAWMEWRPDLTLALPPDLPPEAAAYAVAGRVERWTFHGSPPLLTANATYAADQATRTLWSKQPPAAADDGWTVRLRSLEDGAPAALDVTVAYAYWLITPDGVESVPLAATHRGTATITVLAPQGTAP